MRNETRSNISQFSNSSHCYRLFQWIRSRDPSDRPTSRSVCLLELPKEMIFKVVHRDPRSYVMIIGQSSWLGFAIAAAASGERD